MLEAAWPSEPSCPIERLAAHLEMDPENMRYAESETDEVLRRALHVSDKEMAEAALG